MSDIVGPTFKSELQHLLNKYSYDNMTNTPDYILAAFIDIMLIDMSHMINQTKIHNSPRKCLKAFYSNLLGKVTNSICELNEGHEGSHSDGIIFWNEFPRPTLEVDTEEATDRCESVFRLIEPGLPPNLQCMKVKGHREAHANGHITWQEV